MLREHVQVNKVYRRKVSSQTSLMGSRCKGRPSITQGPDIAQQPDIKMADETSHKFLHVFYLEVGKNKLASKKMSSKLTIASRNG